MLPWGPRWVWACELVITGQEAHLPAGGHAPKSLRALTPAYPFPFCVSRPFSVLPGASPPFSPFFSEMAPSSHMECNLENLVMRNVDSQACYLC